MTITKTTQSGRTGMSLTELFEAEYLKHIEPEFPRWEEGNEYIPVHHDIVNPPPHSSHYASVDVMTRFWIDGNMILHVKAWSGCNPYHLMDILKENNIILRYGDELIDYGVYYAIRDITIISPSWSKLLKEL